MKILYIGDVTSKLGRETVKQLLPGLIKSEHIDFVIAQGENVTHGKGLQPSHADELEAAGVNFFTGGNHSLDRTDALERPNVTRPANLPAGSPGAGYRVVATPFGKILIMTVLGQVVGVNSEVELPNPLITADEILAQHQNDKHVARILNFHGDFSSEKVVAGQYFDGRLTAVIGDHWHVPTADAQVQPKGTAHISDVGMTGALDASLGVKTEVVTRRWLHPETKLRNEMEENGRRQFNAVLIDVDSATGLAKSIAQIRKVLPA